MFIAALPPHSAERLCLSEGILILRRLRLRINKRRSLSRRKVITESHRLSALCGGRAAKKRLVNKNE
jgi:hypothetical protein